MTKFEMHMHTSECDVVARVSGAEIVKIYCDKTYKNRKTACIFSDNTV